MEGAEGAKGVAGMDDMGGLDLANIEWEEKSAYPTHVAQHLHSVFSVGCTMVQKSSTNRAVGGGAERANSTAIVLSCLASAPQT